MPKKNRPAKAKDTTAAPLGTERVKLLLSRNKIQKRIRELAKAIRIDFPTEPLLLLGVLKGAVLFLADLSRQIPGEVTFDFIAVSSYGKDSRTSGQVKLDKKHAENFVINVFFDERGSAGQHHVQIE